MTTLQAHPDEATLIERILRLPIFEGYTEHGVKTLLDAGTLTQAPDGEIILHEHAPPAEVLLLIDGALEVVVEKESSEITVAEATPGQIVGEIALLCEMPRTASVRAKENSTLLVWEAKAFRQLLFSDAGFGRRIFRQSLRAVIESEKQLLRSLD